MPSLTLRAASPADTDRCFEIERTAYEGAEAATREKIATRIARYPDGFLVLEQDGDVIGFINGGCAHRVEMADDAFKEMVGHDPAAPHVVIMSVAVDPRFQRRGHATRLMDAFAERMQAAGKRTLNLMCRDRHIDLYRRLGFCYLRPSASDHGGRAWHDMLRALAPGLAFSWARLDDLPPRDVHAMLRAREAVFVVEQCCAYQEADDADADAWHLFGRIDGALAAYARVVPPGPRAPRPAIGRVMTTRAFRERGLGRALVLEAIRHAETAFPGQGIRISAQAHLRAFYASLGFDAHGPVYDEDGIAHVAMTKTPPPSRPQGGPPA